MFAEGHHHQTQVEEERVEEKGEGMGGEGKEVGMTEDEDWEIGTPDPFGHPLLYPYYSAQKLVKKIQRTD